MKLKTTFFSKKKSFLLQEKISLMELIKKKTWILVTHLHVKRLKRNLIALKRLFSLLLIVSPKSKNLFSKLPFYSILINCPHIFRTDNHSSDYYYAVPIRKFYISWYILYIYQTYWSSKYIYLIYIKSFLVFFIYALQFKDRF